SANCSSARCRSANCTLSPPITCRSVPSQVPSYPSVWKASGQGRPPARRPHREGRRVRRESCTAVPPKEGPSRVRSRRAHPPSQVHVPPTYGACTPASRGAEAIRRCNNTSAGKVSTTKETKHASVYSSQPARGERRGRCPAKRPSRPKAPGGAGQEG